jgi:manganese/iron transport system substrate-binding protein
VSALRHLTRTVAETRSHGVTAIPDRVIALVATLLLVGLPLAGCGGANPASSGNPDAVRVVTTTPVLADLVAQVGGEHVTVESLVPNGGEVHTFDPTPSDARRLAAADLVFLNGLGLDDWLVKLVASSGTTAPAVALAENLDGVTYLAGDGTGETVNPHLWLNVQYAIKYAERIAGELAGIDPAHAADYDAGLATYRTQLEALDAMARDTLGAIPEANRTVISFHDAFPYFAAAYGLKIDGTIVDAPGQDPSAGAISELIRAVREDGVKAIFAEAQFNDELARTIADETGAVVVSNLYTGTLGDAPQDTYVGAMTWNVEQVAAALGGG